MKIKPQRFDKVTIQYDNGMTQTKIYIDKNYHAQLLVEGCPILQGIVDEDNGTIEIGKEFEFKKHGGTMKATILKIQQ